MKSQRSRARRAAKFVSLFGTSSFLVLSASAAHAAAAGPVQAAPVEEVLITGSLIRGAPAVGVPVTALGQEDFQEAGALSIADMLKNIPALVVDESVGTVTTSGANRQRLQDTQIHGLGGTDQATLLMVNGMRYPPQGTNLENLDPSLIPQLAVERVDVLTAGASAVYGSDAVAGVVNVIMKRAYNGAITQARVGMSTDLGWKSANYQAAVLFGRTWDNIADLGPGDLTLSYEWFDRTAVHGPGRDYYTVNFEPFGYDNRTPLASSQAGVISSGNPAGSLATLGYPIPTGGNLSAQLGDRYCGNCFIVPVGTGWDFGSQNPGPAISWSQLTQMRTPTTGAANGVNTFRSPYEFSWMNPAQQGNFATLTFDQQIFEDAFGLGPVELFADAFYMARRSQNAYIPGWSPCARCLTVANGVTVPTNNPYRPTGVPAGTVVRAHFSLGDEWIPKSDAGSISGRFAFGLNFDELPFDWRGRVFFSSSEETSWAYTRQMVNVNMFDAAMGNTVASQAAAGTSPPHLAFTKPANIPYLNPFCDWTAYRCQSPQTLEYIRARRDDFSEFETRQFGINIDGPVFDLPGGPVMAAVGAEKLTQHFFFINPTNENAFHTEIMITSRQYEKQLSGAVFGQLNVPIVGEDMMIPFMRELIVELGYRYDYYYELGGVTSPKIQTNWDVGYGLLLRAAWGTSFTAPAFGHLSNYSGVRETHELINVAGSRASFTTLNCPAHANAGIVAGTVSPGSLQAYFNPNRLGCPAGGGLPAGPADPNLNTFNSASQPVGIDLGSSLLFEQGVELQPSDTKQWSLGFGFSPDPDVFGTIAAGFNLNATWWFIYREGTIGTIQPGQGVNDPASLEVAAGLDPYQSRYYVIPRPDLAITAPENAEFKAFVDQIISTGKAAFDPNAVPFVKWVNIVSIGNNTGWSELSGLDFDARYDWDMGAWGSANVGVSGWYELRNRDQDAPGAPINNTYTQILPDGTPDGANSGHQLQRVRFRSGWQDMEAHWNFTLGATWNPHTIGGTAPPPCFWREDFGPGTAQGLCYPGAPYYPQPKYTAPSGTPQPTQRFSGLLHPSEMFFDLAVSYNTGDAPTNPYLQNLRVGLNVNNILNRLPSSLTYDPRTSSGSPRIREGADFQRTVSVTVTKVW